MLCQIALIQDMARTKCCGMLFIGQASYINRETYYVLLANYTILYVSAIFISRQRLSPKYHTTVPGTFTIGDPNSLRLQRIHIDSKVVERSSMYCKVMKLWHFLDSTREHCHYILPKLCLVT